MGLDKGQLKQLAKERKQKEREEHLKYEQKENAYRATVNAIRGKVLNAWEDYVDSCEWEEALQKELEDKVKDKYYDNVFIEMFLYNVYEIVSGRHEDKTIEICVVLLKNTTKIEVNTDCKIRDDDCRDLLIECAKYLEKAINRKMGNRFLRFIGKGTASICVPSNDDHYRESAGKDTYHDTQTYEIRINFNI